MVIWPTDLFHVPHIISTLPNTHLAFESYVGKELHSFFRLDLSLVLYIANVCTMIRRRVWDTLSWIISFCRCAGELYDYLLTKKPTIDMLGHFQIENLFSIHFPSRAFMTSMHLELRCLIKPFSYALRLPSPPGKASLNQA